ncbi:MAG: DNA repair protein RecN [Prevotella sp.]|nr:DNA repair protein RecN [Prevotella sp.]
MLKQLYINNFTLIDKLEMEFFPGFSVITGETGAGKSIILGAISLLLGQRADTRVIKNGTGKCTIEAHFDIRRYDMKSFFDDNDIEYDPDDCILRRELTASGKSRSFINDTPVLLTLMRQLGQQLLDIHSQHKNLLIQEADFQLSVVDIIADNQDLLNDYKEAFREYKNAETEVKRLKELFDNTRANEDFMRFQYNELCEVQLTEGMQAELEQEATLMSHAEDIKEGLFNASHLLDEDDNGVLDKLKNATRSLNSISALFPDLNETNERLESCYIELQDISSDIDTMVGKVDFNPQRFQMVQDELDRIYTLEKKHQVDSVEQLLAIRNNLKEQLDKIENSDEELELAMQKVEQAKAKCKQKANQLTSSRQKAADKIEKEMKSRLVPLGMPNVRFEVEMKTKELSSNGENTISFLFSANTSSPMQPVSEVASGGEIARVMLALKAMISGAVKLPTIIFDEIDTGVSGNIAERMAIIMKEMGQNDRQVISITHLPQIAALGSTHYKVVKEETPTGTVSQMLLLQPEERVVEIAKMLSGANVSDAAMNNARALLMSSASTH